MKRAISVVAATVACALGAAASASAATDVQQAQSGNWSGYVAGANGQSTTFKSVSGSWVVPTAKCTSASSATYSAFWVGLGGAGNADALEQAGTEANCTTSGSTSYYAWYELVPKAPVRIDLPVSAGDHISTTVTVDGTSVSILLKDETSGQSFSKTLTMSDPDVTSAEWIAEAPSECQGSTTGECTALPLTDFGSVQFSSASATDSSGQTGSISDSTWGATAVTLSPSEGTMGFQGASYSPTGSSGGATPSSLSSSGSAFSVAYSADAGEGASSGSGYGGGSSGGYGGGSSGGYGSGDGYGAGGYGSGDGYGAGGYGYGYGAGGYGAGGYGAGGYGDGGYAYGAGGYGSEGYGSEGYGYAYGGSESGAGGSYSGVPGGAYYGVDAG
jgi:Peptidase A4 family